MERRCWSEDVLPFTALVSIECIKVGTKVSFKAASLNGMSFYVYILYSYLVSTLVLLPLFFFSTRRAGRPPFNFSFIFRVCLLGLIWFSFRILTYKGLEFSSPTLSSAMGNLIPAFTFMLAVVFRMEKLAVRNFTTHAKIIGTLVSMSGALVILLYKGPKILSISSPTSSIWLQWPLSSSESHWIIGGLLLAVSTFCLSISYIIQVQILKMYPAEIAVFFLYNLLGMIIAAPVCFIAEENLGSWKLETGGTLVAVLYEGVIDLPLFSVVHLWGVHVKGPLYVAMFKPLSIAIAAFLSFIFLGNALHVGSVVGAIIISLGFYAVLWGKAKEQKSIAGSGSSNLAISSDGKTPLLQSQAADEVTEQ